MKKLFLSCLASVLLIGSAHAQYNSIAKQNVITEEVQVERVNQATQEVEIITEVREVQADSYGNAEGNQYDLAVDGAFEGQTIAVLHLYTGEGFDFSYPTASLKEKGFSVYRWINNPPSAEELEKALDKSCQLWIVSSNRRKLNEDHAKVIKKYFDSGKGVYIWGDNQPYYADANYIADYLIGNSMTGNVMGDQTVGLLENEKKSGIMPNHLITTGLQNIYEGITIATIAEHKDLTPIIYGSSGNLVTAAYEKDGKRLLVDGGFTRLFLKWDTAGTGRYVKNAAAWLVNYERFGDEVIAKK
ncbi:hypothetical protein [Brumimicrobium aurantiacum]|uniref:Uncharacterized protein n=1 Tax=Brumimicrobium aurantiacum TaxID=1737063 RepID=A0A3E1EY86_9FLAO|nr:hypothetical protein [Brumimicrobium aurantiacum]RFC54512.1 hypothetical protein DXU93_05865 [Brumimicrobium aurantiacum]